MPDGHGASLPTRPAPVGVTREMTFADVVGDQQRSAPVDCRTHRAAKGVSAGIEKATRYVDRRSTTFTPAALIRVGVSLILLQK